MFDGRVSKLVETNATLMWQLGKVQRARVVFETQTPRLLGMYANCWAKERSLWLNG